MKAKALGMDGGEHTEKNVAVKMLKSKNIFDVLMHTVLLLLLKF